MIFCLPHAGKDLAVLNTCISHSEESVLCKIGWNPFCGCTKQIKKLLTINAIEIPNVTALRFNHFGNCVMDSYRETESSAPS